MSITISHLMTTPVVTVRRDTPFKDVVARVRAARVSAVPVIDDCGRVIGMVSEADLLAWKARWDHGSLQLGGWRHRWDRHRGPTAAAVTVMSSPVVTVRAEATLTETARLMCRHRVTSLAVVDTAGRLIGIVSQRDLLDTFTRPDEEIQREVIRHVITRDFLFDPGAFVITARDGIVTLCGQLESDQSRLHLDHSRARRSRRSRCPGSPQISGQPAKSAVLSTAATARTAGLWAICQDLCPWASARWREVMEGEGGWHVVHWSRESRPQY